MVWTLYNALQTVQFLIIIQVFRLFYTLWLDNRQFLFSPSYFISGICCILLMAQVSVSAVELGSSTH